MGKYSKMSGIVITTNHRERRVKFDVLDGEYINAYGRELPLTYFQPASDLMLAEGWDEVMPIVETNSGAAGVCLSWFDRDGYERENPVAGWYVV